MSHIRSASAIKASLSNHTREQPELQYVQQHHNRSTPIRLPLKAHRGLSEFARGARAAALPKAAAIQTAAVIRDAGDADDAAALPTPVAAGSAPRIGHFSWATSTHPSLYPSGRVSAPSPGTSAPCPAGRRPAPLWRCRCTAPPRLC